MAEELELAAQYRKHAKALRAAAKFDKHIKTSVALSQVARAYEHMADALEGIHRTNKTVGRDARPNARGDGQDGSSADEHST